MSEQTTGPAQSEIVDRTRARTETPMEPPDQAAGEDGPAEHAEQSWLSFHVHSAVEALPDQERVLLELAYWGGLSQSEIADFLNIPLGTVKTRTRSALGRLSDVLGDVR